MGRQIDFYNRLSADGSIVISQNPNLIWTYPTGQGPLTPPGGTPMAQIRNSSPDLSYLLGTVRNGTGTVVATRSGEALWSVAPSTVPSTGSASFVSPNGEYVAGGRGLETPSGLTALDAARWSRTAGFELLDRTGYVAADTFAVTNDGTVYGHGYRATPVLPGRNPVSGYIRDEVVRWTPSGALERLAWNDESGQPWRLRLLQDVSADGALRAGWGTFTIESETGVDEISIQGVFGDSGLLWSFWDERFDDFRASPSRVGVSSDGSIVFGSYDVPLFPLREPRIWTRDGGDMTFSIFLRSMGIDPTGWTFSEIRDMSDDGRSFLVFGSEIGGDGYQFLVVVPEPGTALLVGLGLLGLAFRGGRHSRSTFG